MDKINQLARKFRMKDHPWLFSLVMSPPPKDRDLTYPPLSIRKAVNEAEEFGPTLAGAVSDFYGGADVEFEGGLYKRNNPLGVYVLSRDVVVARILLEIGHYDPEDRRQNVFTPIASLDAGVEDCPAVNRLMDGLSDKVVLRKGRMGGDIDCYALLVEVDPRGLTGENHWTDEAALRKVGFTTDRCRIYDHKNMINPKH